MKTIKEIAPAAPEAAVVAAAAAAPEVGAAVVVIHTVARAQLARRLVRLAAVSGAVPNPAVTVTVP